MSLTHLLLMAMIAVSSLRLELTPSYSLGGDSARWLFREVEPATAIEPLGALAEQITMRTGAMSLSFDGCRISFD